MSEVKTFFRHCPACGRRFEIRIVKKEPVGDEMTIQTLPESAGPLGVLGLRDEKPVTVDMKDFSYTYRCEHCGHVWKEIHEKEDMEPAPKAYPGYTGD